MRIRALWMEATSYLDRALPVFPSLPQLRKLLSRESAHSRNAFRASLALDCLRNCCSFIKRNRRVILRLGK